MLDIPLDMVVIISDYISPTNFLCLSLTYKSLQESSVVKQAIYRALFNRDDSPVGHYRDFVKTHKPRYDYLLNELDDTTEPCVEGMAMYAWGGIGVLQRIVKLTLPQPERKLISRGLWSPLISPGTRGMNGLPSWPS